MAKYKVLNPFVTMGEGGRSYTQGDEYEPVDAGEAERMIAGGILEAPKGQKPPVVESADSKHKGVEKAVKPDKKDGDS